MGEVRTGKRGQSWPVLLTLVAVFGAGYVLVMNHLWTGVAKPTSAVAVFPATSTRDVPNSAVRAIATRLGGLRGRSRELVVTTAASGVGYDVSATVDLGEDASVARSAWTGLVKEDVPLYFQGVFGSQEPVQLAQVYFTVGGQIVAGAALGKEAYQNLTASASGGGNWVSTLAGLAPVTANGPSARWFEITKIGAG